MATLDLKVELPDDVAREAEAWGLLTQQAIESWLREEASQPAVEFDVPPPTQSELDSTLAHLRSAHIRTAAGDRPPEITMDEIPQHDPESPG